ncbi:YciI family protein [Paenibacillus sp. S-38]|uniref:YciI family protein n=1 Tax=Paenibacillus sp. S-38 TaxID=3416710 RepID=UPI003CF08CA0
MFFVKLTYKMPLEVVDIWVEEHRAFLRRQYEASRQILSGPRTPREGGVLLLDAGSREEAGRILAEDPFHREGVADYELVEFKATMYDERLKEVFG